MFSQEKKSFDVRSPPKHKLSMFLEQNREELQIIQQQYAREHLPELSIELMSENINDTLMAAMLKTRFDVVPVEENYELTVQSLHYEHGLKKINPSTIYNWKKLLGLGFMQKPRRKGYDVDGHKFLAIIEFRSNFVQCYLTYDRRMYRWIQVTFIFSHNECIFKQYHMVKNAWVAPGG